MTKPDTDSRHRSQKIKTKDKISTTLRLVPDLHERIATHCDSLGLSVNAYVISLIEIDLRQHGK